MPLRTITALVWTTILLTACLLPRAFLQVEPSHVKAGIPHLDKLVHSALFAGFGWLWTQSARTRRGRVLVVVAGCALAVLTELGQGLPIIDRDADPLDGLADVIGLSLGVGLAQVQFRWSSLMSGGVLEPEGSASSG